MTRADEPRYVLTVHYGTGKRQAISGSMDEDTAEDYKAQARRHMNLRPELRYGSLTVNVPHSVAIIPWSTVDAVMITEDRGGV